MTFLRLTTCVFATVCCLIVGATTAVQAQTKDCIIASNDGRNGFRTDQISQCRIDTRTGNATFTVNGQNQQRTYSAVQPLTTRHLEIATYWLKRPKQLRFLASNNPAGLDVQEFLNEASKATHGFVLVRNRRSGPALNLVYITNGVYRSIDLPSTNLRKKPSGFLIAR